MVFTNMVQCLASGHGSLVDKLRLVLQRFWMLLSPSCLQQRREALAVIANQVVAITTDQGTESGLTNAVLQDLREGLPSWLRSLLPEPAVEEARGPQSVFQSAIAVPGGNHILHNLSWQMDAAIPHFQDFLSQLQSIVTLLHYKHHRENFLHRCVEKTHYAECEAARALRRGGIPKTVEWRWNYIADILGKVLPLEGLLRSTFQAAKMKGADGSEAVEQGVEGELLDEAQVLQEAEDMESSHARQRLGRLDIHLTHAAIHDGLFWNFAKVLAMLHQSLLDLGGWMEACPCHQAQQSFGKADWALLQAIRDDLSVTEHACDSSSFVCPLAGLRAAEMAAGDWRETFASLAELRWQDLLSQLVLPSDADIALLLSVFDAGKLQITATLEAKLLQWSSLPWKLAGLGHHVVPKARKVAQEVLVEWASMDQRPSEHHHVTLRFLGQEGLLLPQVQQFADGLVEMSDVPELAAEVSRLRFIPLSERKVIASVVHLTPQHYAATVPVTQEKM